MSETLLSIQSLSVEFGHAQQQPVRVVDEISLDVHTGEKLALVGESGSGKSVTALSILRLHDPHQVSYATGQVLFEGQN